MMNIKSLFKSPSDGKFGTIKGVYIPNVLQMIGVILFMRLGWILGHVGIVQMGIIILISSTLLLLTTLSMTAIVSNMRMRGGGSYYLISRSLGIEFGSAIGVLQCISQLCSIALCVTGFSLSIHELFPDIPIYFLKAVTLSILVLISYISTDLALKTQFLIFLSLAASIFAVFFCFEQKFDSLPLNPVTTSLTFWAGFSMFFPATTGIESGMAMSGDLRTPSRSLPIGTLASVATVCLLYFCLAIFLSFQAPYEYLKAYPFLLYYTNKYSSLILVGVWAATLSSALGAILGGPRIMQAVAKDKILPEFLAKGYGATNQPRVSTLLVYLLAMVLTLFMDIDQIIPILTMVCLVSYGLINFIAFSQSYLKNPSWRPSLRIPPTVSLIGSIGCFAAMLMINPGATFIVLTLVTLLCVWTSKRKVNGNWEDIRFSLYSYFVHKGTVKLSNMEKSVKHWRPHIFALFDEPKVQKNLAFFAHALNQEKGFLTFGTPLPTAPSGEVTASLKQHLREFKIPCHVHANSYEDPLIAADQMIKNYGFGNLKPNTILFSIPSSFSSQEDFIKLLLNTHAQKKNIVLLKDDFQMDYTYSDPSKVNKRINLWWRGKYPGSFELCLALAFLLQQSNLWPKSNIRIKMIAKNEDKKEELIRQFGKYQSKLRIKNLEFSPIVDETGDFLSNLTNASQSADLTFLGLKRPTEKTTVQEYKEYYEMLLEKTADVKNVAYVLSGESVRFRKIFL